MKTRIIALAVTAACASAAVAQSQYEALQFMGNELNGTARFVGMGGAMSSLGADLSTMSTNPAGIGMYRSHDVAVSFGFNNTRTNADFAGSTTKENRTRASFDQIGFVWSTKIGNKTDLRYLNFGFNYHKRANFNRQFYAKGNLNGASMTYQMAKMIGSVASTWDDLITLWNAGIKGVDNRNPYIHEDFYSVPYLGMMGYVLIWYMGVEIQKVSSSLHGMEKPESIIVVRREELISTTSTFRSMCAIVFILV